MPREITLSATDRERLRALGVAAIYLVGSRATGTATPRSDYDVSVILDRGTRARDERTHPDLHAALYALLSDRLPRGEPPPAGMLRDLDVVFLQRAPLYYTTHALRHGRLLYDGNPRARVAFEERARALVMDFAPLRRELERSLLAAL